MPFETLAPERILTRLGFALLLTDAYSGAATLLGDVTVTTDGIEGRRRDGTGAFLFPGLPPGPRLFSVRSGRWTPFYRAVDIIATLPASTPEWPAFPDCALADPSLMLDDPGQPLAYRRQRELVALLPATAYPFGGAATLARGTVRHAAADLAGAAVSRAGGTEPAYATGADGQFVLFFPQLVGSSQAVTIRAEHPVHGTQDAAVTLLRGRTVSLRFEL